MHVPHCAPIPSSMPPSSNYVLQCIPPLPSCSTIQQITVTQTADQGATGNFEVTVNGTLVHSKSTRGQGRCESSEETQRVVDAITDALE